MIPPPPELQLEHTTDEHTEVLARIDALRARGQDALAATIERAYRARAKLQPGTRPPAPPKRRRRRRR